MGSSSSKRKTNNVKNRKRTVTLAGPEVEGSGKGRGSAQPVMAWDGVSASVNLATKPRLYQRSKSEDRSYLLKTRMVERSRSECQPGLNKSLSSSLRFSDFCKISRRERVESEEVKPIYIPYRSTFKVTPEDLCHICSVYTGSETYTCAVCFRVYHESCLAKIGQCQNEAAVKYLHASSSPAGWSCDQCDNVSNLLTEEEMCELLDTCRKCHVMPDQELTPDQYLAYRKLHYKGQLGSDMTSEEVREELCVTGQLSKSLTGHIDWTTLLNHEALKVLEKRNRNSLVRHMSEAEIEMARQMFQCRDKDGQGEISNDDFRRLTSAFDQIYHITYRQEKMPFADADLSGSTNWECFLREMSIFLIAGRLNLFRQAAAEVRRSADEEVASQQTTARSTKTVTITSKETPRKGTSRSLYVISSSYGLRSLLEGSQRRPMSLA